MFSAPLLPADDEAVRQRVGEENCFSRNQSQRCCLLTVKGRAPGLDALDLVLFVLQAALHGSVPDGLWWMSSFGAGFSCHGALLEVAGP